jgi:hypothetical protein
MRHRFLLSGDLAPQQRRRLDRVLIGPLAARVLLPAVAVWWGFILTVLLVTRDRRPDIDTNGWPFILAVFPVSCLVFVSAMTVGHVLFVRWLIRYRTGRRGRAVAVRCVLCPSDREPSRWRRLWLSACGVTDADRSGFLDWIDRSRGDPAPTAPAPDP